MKPRMADPENEPTRHTLFPEQGQVDGRGEEVADPVPSIEEESGHTLRVLTAIRGYMDRRNRKGHG